MEDMRENKGGNKMKITATVKSLKEILTGEDVREYTPTLIKFMDDTIWNFEMNKYIDEEIKLGKYDGANNYQYENENYYFKKEWLKDIKEEIDWSTIPPDTKVLVTDEGIEEWYPRYFKEYQDNKFVCYSKGTTSWSSEDETTSWEYCKLAEEEK